VKSRLVASVALGAAVMLGATGCSMISPQATTIQYSPSDGVFVDDSGPLKVRNVLIVANEDGSQGNLIAAIVNDTAETQTLRMEIGEGSGVIEKSVRVPANTILSFGTEETEPLLLDGLDTMPGADIPIYFQSGDSDGTVVSVAVLDGAQKYLAHLVP